jgi:hypothetical protein
MGFSVVEDVDDTPRTVDWEAFDEGRVALFPDRQRRERRAA